MDYLGWLGQPDNAVFIPLIAALLSGTVAVFIALMNLWSQDVTHRRLSSLEKLVSLSKEIGDLDERLKGIIRHEIDSEVKTRFQRRGIYAHNRRYWLKFISILLCSWVIGSWLWALDMRDNAYFIERFWTPPPQATAATIAYLYMLLCSIAVLSLWAGYTVIAIYMKKRKGQFVEVFIDRFDS